MGYLGQLGFYLPFEGDGAFGAGRWAIKATEGNWGINARQIHAIARLHAQIGMAEQPDAMIFIPSSMTIRMPYEFVSIR